MRATDWRWYTASLLAADALLLGLSFVLAATVREWMDVVPSLATFSTGGYGFVAAGLIPGLVAILWLRRAYARDHLLAGPDEYVRIISGCTYGTLLVVAVSYFRGDLPLVSRGWLLIFWVIAIVLVATGRFALRHLAHALRHRGWFVRRALIVGANDQGLAMAQQLHGREAHGVEVVGFLDDFLPPGTQLGLAAGESRHAPGSPFVVLSHPRDMHSLAIKLGVDLLLVVPSALSWESMHEIAGFSAGTEGDFDVRLAPTLYDLSAAGVEAAPMEFIPLVRMRSVHLGNTDRFLKRTLDLIGASVLLLALSPILGCALVLARSRGVRPFLVWRSVLGRGGRVVTLAVLNPLVTERLLLRGAPALLAVVRGDLGLAGPRPVPVEERAAYEPWAGHLLAMRPGLTGPWRLTAQADRDAQVLADVWWIRNWTPWQHLFVLFQTLRVTWGMAEQQHLGRWESSSPKLQPPVSPIPVESELKWPRTAAL